MDKDVVKAKLESIASRAVAVERESINPDSMAYLVAVTESAADVQPLLESLLAVQGLLVETTEERADNRWIHPFALEDAIGSGLKDLDA